MNVDRSQVTAIYLISLQGAANNRFPHILAFNSSLIDTCTVAYWRLSWTPDKLLDFRLEPRIGVEVAAAHFLGR